MHKMAWLWNKVKERLRGKRPNQWGNIFRFTIVATEITFLKVILNLPKNVVISNFRSKSESIMETDDYIPTASVFLRDGCPNETECASTS